MFRRLYSRTAFIIVASYAVLELGLAIYVVLHVEAEGKPFAFLILGFPWSVCAVAASRWIPDLPDWALFALVLFLNATTLYALSVMVIRLVKSEVK